MRAPTAASRAPIDRPVAVADGVGGASPATYYVHTDHLHRPIRMSNAAKSFVWQAEYQPWGAVQSLSGPLTLDLRFPGQWFQLEAGLHYNWHRHYDPSLGRYTQADPLGFVDGPSVYGYARGNPYRYVDPDGRLLTPRPLPPSLPITSSPGGSGSGGGMQPPGSGGGRKPPKCTLFRANKPGSVLNPICKNCYSCDYQCKGGEMVGGGFIIRRFQIGGCKVLTGFGWVPGFATETECEKAAGEGGTSDDVYQGDIY